MAKIRKLNVKHESANISGISLGTTITTLDTSNVLGLNLDNCTITIEATIIATEINLGESATIKHSATYTKKNGTIVKAVQGAEILNATSGILNFLSSSLSNSGNLLIVNVSNINALANFEVDSFLDLYVGNFDAPFVDNVTIFA